MNDVDMTGQGCPNSIHGTTSVAVESNYLSYNMTKTLKKTSGNSVAKRNEENRLLGINHQNFMETNMEIYVVNVGQCLVK